ncbi:hypothetical protein ACFPZL_13075, partial [Leucobacter soli]|uniref:hypothetical protein n=1 Tax=Leucobacter soli TaxID=2812850 RepID=UPI0036118331
RPEPGRSRLLDQLTRALSLVSSRISGGVPIGLLLGPLATYLIVAMPPPLRQPSVQSSGSSATPST